MRFPAAQPAADLDPVEARQHHVEHDQVVRRALGFLEAGDAVGHPAHVAVDGREVQLEQAADVGVVFDHQDASVHGPSPAAAPIALRWEA